MTIRTLLAGDTPTLSYELFPPRTPEADSALWDTFERLVTTDPDFISVTYGAAGSTRSSSREVVERLLDAHTLPVLAHLTCVGASRAELIEVVEGYLAEDVTDFLALRGDPPKGEPDWRPHPDGLHYASELVALIHEVGAAHGIDDLSIGVTAFPTQHAQEQWRQQALDVLRAKQDAGAHFAITQVFYDVDSYVSLVRDARAQGIVLPIIPEVVPVASAARASRLEQITGVPTPPELIATLAAADSPDEALERGVAACADFSKQLLDAGAPGIHVITFNKHTAPLELVASLGLA